MRTTLFRFAPLSWLKFIVALWPIMTLAQSVYEPYTFTTLAGMAGKSGSADGTRSTARFNCPMGIAVDNAGNVYVSDLYNCTIRKVTPAGDVTTLAGSLPPGSADGTGSAARFNWPIDVVVDNAGNVYVADQLNNTIRKMTPAGVVTTLAGLAGTSGSANGLGSAARFYHPSGVAMDTGGNVYVADNYTIRKVTSAGEVTTLAGEAGVSGSADGTGSAARFNGASDVAVDSAGNVYVADNHTIRKMTLAGEVTTLAGQAGVSGSADGTGSAARFNGASNVAVDSAGNIYAADGSNHTIRKVTPTGVVTTLAGRAGSYGSADGLGSVAGFHYPSGVAVDRAGNVYVADQANNTIRKGWSAMSGPPMIVTDPAGGTVAATSQVTFSVVAFGAMPLTYQWWHNGTPIPGQTNTTLTLANVQATDAGNYVVVVNNAAGSVTSQVAVLTVALPITVLLEPGSSTNWQANAGDTIVFTATNTTAPPLSYQWSKDGIVIIGATNAALVLKEVQVANSGVYSVVVTNQTSYGTAMVTLLVVPPPGSGDYTFLTLAGAAEMSGSANGTGSAARFNNPYGVVADLAHNVYVADRYNHTIRKVTAAGEVTTLAGFAGSYGSADGSGSIARFMGPAGVAVDRAGNLYVADRGNNTIRKVTSAGVVTTLAGQAGVSGSADGTGSATRFNSPSGVAVDSAGNVYVADTSNHTIRKVTPAVGVTTLAGLAGSYGSTDGTGSAARFKSPSGVAVDSAGNVYIADDGNHTIRLITSAGVVSTLAGQAGSFGSTDGLANTARFGCFSGNIGGEDWFSGPTGLAVDNGGNVYVADNGNYTIRRITVGRMVSTLAGLAGSAGSADGTGSKVRFGRLIRGCGRPCQTYYNFRSGPSGVAVDSAGNVYVADSDNHTIRMGSPPVIAEPSPHFMVPQNFANGQVKLTMLVNANLIYVIQVSTNLSSWLDWTNVSSTSTNILVTDPEAANYGQRFYRIIRR